MLGSSLLFSPPILPLGLVQSFVESTFIGQAIVVLLVLVSVYAWAMMLHKHNQLARVHRETEHFYMAFRQETHPLGMFVQRLRFPGSPAYRVYLRACQAAARVLRWEDLDPGQLMVGENRLLQADLSEGQVQIIREAAERELADRVLELEQDMTMLATITSVAPFLGLLGTVWGVMDSFNGMAVTGSPTLSNVAPGISAALLTTVVGLLVAIPSVIGYNILNARLRNATVGMDNFVQELIGEFHHSHVSEG